MSRTPGAAVLLVSGALLALVWTCGRPAVPLYDGLQGPVGPYRYLEPPPGFGPQHSHPTSGRTVERLTFGRFTETAVQTRERVPQAFIQLGDGAVMVPGGITRVTLAIRPVPPPGPINSGVLDGNVYLFTATGDNGRPVRLDPKVGGLLQLRKTGRELSAQMEMYKGGRWSPLPTLAFVNANYLATDAKSFGYYALIAPSHQSAFLTRYLPLLIAAVVILVLVVTGLVAIRLTRRPGVAEEIS